MLADPVRLAAVRATGLLDGPPRAALDEVVDLARRLLRAPTAGISLVEAHRQFFTSALGFPEPVASTRETPIAWSFCAHVVETGAAFVVDDARLDPRVSDNPAVTGLLVEAYLGVPLRGPTGSTLGALCAIDQRPRCWRAEDEEILRGLAAVASGVLVSAAVAVEALGAAGRDPLTGLPNRAALEGLLRHAGPGTAVLFVDLDGFKAVNDRYGREAGDRVLQEAARRLAETTGGRGVVARFGGDELVVVAEANEAAARSLGEAMVAVLAEPIELAEDLRVRIGCSVGVASGGGRNGSALLEAADQGVLAAKRAGGGRVVLAGPGAVAAGARRCRTVRGEGRTMVGGEGTTSEERPVLEALLAEGAVVPAYQPIVELDTGRVVGYEALARWPDLGCSPAAAFAVAREAGSLVELDWRCRVAAAEHAVAAGLGRETALFVNVEPAAVGEPPPWAARWMDDMARRLRPVVELTERALLRAPALLLHAVERIRSRGWPIALDDVGADPASLAVLPILRPEVVKLDLNLVRHQPDAAIVRVLAAVMAYAEATGAVVVAEGIETEEDEERARAFGAHLGQGWRFGRPGPLAPPDRPGPRRLGAAVHPVATVASPFDLVKDAELRVAPAHLVLAISRHLEQSALVDTLPPAVLGVFQEARRLAGATADTYRRLGARSPLVVAYGVGMAPDPLPGVRGVALDLDDPLREEWTVAVVGPHYAAALIGRSLGDRGPWASRRFAYTVTHDRDRVLVCARSLLARLGRPLAP